MAVRRKIFVLIFNRLTYWHPAGIRAYTAGHSGHHLKTEKIKVYEKVI